MIEQRGWEALCAHQKSGYVAVVREFYLNLVGRKDNTVFVRGVWVPYGAKAINQVYGMAEHKHGSKFKKLLENQDLKKIAEKLIDGKAQLRQEKGGLKTLNRGSLTKEAKVWFYFLAFVLVPTRHLSTVREQEAIMLYAILKGYKINIGTIIENSIMRYHEGNKRGDSSPSKNNGPMFKGWGEGSLGNRRRSSFDTTALTDRSEQGTPKPD